MEVWMTEGPRVNFVMREALFDIYTWILCLSYLHEKQTSRIQSLYLLVYFIKIVPFRLWNIRFEYTTGRYSEQPPEQPTHTSRMFLHGKMDVKIFLMFIVAENTGNVNMLNSNALLSKRNFPYEHIYLHFLVPSDMISV